MKKQQFIDILILLGGIAFLGGIIFKITGQNFLFLPVAYWRFAMGCLALAIALSVQKS